jgi:nucleotide-binding universal stress UspA family protein
MRTKWSIIDMNDNVTISVTQAVQDFRSARQKATLREVITRFTGDNNELLSFNEVSQKLRAQMGPKKVLKEIPIDDIVGSVNRYQDFSRDFLPGKNINPQRWANIELANYGSHGLPPIEVYQIDQAYFVSDGNHRVSVAKQLGVTQIQAYVTEVHTRVTLTPDIRPEDLILKSEYADFLEHTNLDKIRPESDLTVTVPGQYEVIEEHIAVHRYFMGIEQQHEIALPEAIADWYDTVYLPVVNIIRERGLLIDFPDRTEADLYLWIADHRAALEEELKSEVEIANAADDLAGQFSQRPYRVIARIGSKFIKALVPRSLATGPSPGEWRQSVVTSRREDQLFNEILVPINGREDGWYGLEQAFIFAQREGANLNGLFIVQTDAELTSTSSKEILDQFTRRCEASGVKCDLQMKMGDIVTTICDRARWQDLVIVNLTYPPASSAVARWSSGIRNLIHRCPRPILFTPQTTTPLKHALLAYDGSLKAQEALFIASYLAAKWQISLSVITIGQDEDIRDIQNDARQYLIDHNVTADYILAEGDKSAEVIIQYAGQLNADLLIIGGYSQNPIFEVIQGGSVDYLLRHSRIPTIVCR